MVLRNAAPPGTDVSERERKSCGDGRDVRGNRSMIDKTLALPTTDKTNAPTTQRRMAVGSGWVRENARNGSHGISYPW